MTRPRKAAASPSGASVRGGEPERQNLAAERGGESKDWPPGSGLTAKRWQERCLIFEQERSRACKALAEFLDEDEDYVENIARLVERLRWRPIETAPRDGARILVANPDRNGYVAIVRWQEGGGVRLSGWRDGLVLHQFDDPSHWMPLPELPK